MQTIAVSSFKGGTAKTSTTLHLASALAQFEQKRVLLIDFDAQANLTTGMGFDPDAYDSLAPVLLQTKTMQEVICTTSIANLDLVPADTWLERVEVTGVLASDRYSHERLKELIQPLNYDFVFIDTPPSLCWLTESALIAANYALICTTPEFYSIKGLERLSLFINSLSQRHTIEILGVVLSFWNARGKNNQAFLDVLENTFPGKLFKSRIRRDVAVSEASIYGRPVFETSGNSRSAKDYLALMHEVLQNIEQTV